MPGMNLGRALAAIVAAVAVLNTLSALSMPVRDRRASALAVVAWLVLLAAHAAAYYFGDRIRERWGLRAYAGTQAILVFAIAVASAPAPVTIGLFMAGTTELVVLAGKRWGTIRITLGAIALFVLAALITADLYRATTAGLLLALTGLIAHAVAALLHRPPPETPRAETTSAQSAHGGAVKPSQAAAAANGATLLSAREIEVLRELVSGARNAEIAARLGISERTVKSHLGSIYQKLGVETRSAAVATAVERKLV
jgi:DNA-binding CsgD family transcriptional regulator